MSDKLNKTEFIHFIPSYQTFVCTVGSHVSCSIFVLFECGNDRHCWNTSDETSKKIMNVLDSERLRGAAMLNYRTF